MMKSRNTTWNPDGDIDIQLCDGNYDPIEARDNNRIANVVGPDFTHCPKILLALEI